MLQQDSLKEKVAVYSFNYLLDMIAKSDLPPAKKLVLGIGSGTTIKFFIKKLAEITSSGSLPFEFTTISSSTDSEVLCRELNLPISHLADLPADSKIDYYIDGADEVDPHKRCLKGLGGASTREKFLRIESKVFFVVIDDSKKVSHLCSKHPIVVEIVPFGFEKTLERIKNFIIKPTKVELRKGSGKMGFVITDNNNYLVDVSFTDLFTEDSDFENIEKNLKQIPGVVETGLFSKPADVVFIASEQGVQILT